MTLTEFYDVVGGNYKDVVERLVTEERVIRYLRRFAEDDGVEMLLRCYKDENIERIFREAHTLKGMCLNLGLSRLQKSTSDLCEEYRNGAPTKDTKAMIEKIKADYKEVVDAVEQL